MKIDKWISNQIYKNLPEVVREKIVKFTEQQRPAQTVIENVNFLIDLTDMESDEAVEIRKSFYDKGYFDPQDMDDILIQMKRFGYHSGNDLTRLNYALCTYQEECDSYDGVVFVLVGSELYTFRQDKKMVEEWVLVGNNAEYIGTGTLAINWLDFYKVVKAAKENDVAIIVV